MSGSRSQLTRTVTTASYPPATRPDGALMAAVAAARSVPSPPGNAAFRWLQAVQELVTGP
jgi:hypothetical protein